MSENINIINVQEKIEITTSLGQEVINVIINGYSVFCNTLKLGELNDVTLTNPQNGETIVYKDGVWINKKLLIVDNDYNCLIGNDE